MSQQINLFNPIFRKKGFSFTSSTAMLYGAGFIIALAALVAVYQDQQLSLVQREAQSAAAAHNEATATLARLTAELAKQKPNAALEAEVAALDAQLQGHQEVIETLKSGAVGSPGGFSDYMRAFSRQNINGLWLTGFDIAGNELALRGRALSADLVAGYLQQLNQEKSLQGRQFAALRISQPAPEPAPQGRTALEAKADKSVAGQKEAKEHKLESPRYLEFTISTVDIPENSQSTAKAAATEAPLLGTINAAAVLEAAKAGAGQEATR